MDCSNCRRALPGTQYWTMGRCPGWTTTRQRAVKGLGGFGTYNTLMQESMAHPKVRYTWGPSRLADLSERLFPPGCKGPLGLQRAETREDAGTCGKYNKRMCAGGRSYLSGEVPFAY